VNYLRFWVLFLLIWGFDLVTKNWAVENAEELRNFPIVVIDWIEGYESLLEFTYVTNPGAAWSMFSDYPQVLTALAGIALICIFVFRKSLELHKPSLQIIFGLICGGIAGNLCDRIFRNPAEVVDFIDVFLPLLDYDYPVFNIADSGIFIGAISYMLIGIRESREAKSLEDAKISADS
jgi:signal peptidase II